MKCAVLTESESQMIIIRALIPSFTGIIGTVLFLLISLTFFAVYFDVTPWRGPAMFRESGGHLSYHDCLLATISICCVFLQGMIPDIFALVSPHRFTFDRSTNSFTVNHRDVAEMNRVRVKLQIGLGATRLSFRIIAVLPTGRAYVLAQTARLSILSLFNGNSIDNKLVGSPAFVGMWSDYQWNSADPKTKDVDYYDITSAYNQINAFLNPVKSP